MAYTPAPKDTLLIPSGSHRNPDAKHLYVILTNTCNYSQHLLVNITTQRDGVFHDPACTIQPGEHRFIINESYVEYKRATVIHTARIIKCVGGWVYTPHDPVSDDLFERIRDGVNSSRFMPRSMKSYFAQNC